MTWIIRPARPEDAEAILAYTRRAGAETDNLSFGSEGLAAGVASFRTLIERLNGTRQGLILIALDQEETVALAALTTSVNARMKHRGELAISVRQDHWGLGIGTDLMTALIRFAGDTAQVDLISLEVRSDNDRAIRLYRKFGFRRTGLLPGYLKIDDTLIDCDLMVLPLTGPL